MSWLLKSWNLFHILCYDFMGLADRLLGLRVRKLQASAALILWPARMSSDTVLAGAG